MSYMMKALSAKLQDRKGISLVEMILIIVLFLLAAGIVLAVWKHTFILLWITGGFLAAAAAVILLLTFLL